MKSKILVKFEDTSESEFEDTSVSEVEDNNENEAKDNLCEYSLDWCIILPENEVKNENDSTCLPITMTHLKAIGQDGGKKLIHQNQKKTTEKEFTEEDIGALIK
ncbi:1269_t:CDS:2 [Gigaspora rosea]|nr:1269_t:CDS:2 [Gigaspora rosea]